MLKNKHWDSTWSNTTQNLGESRLNLLKRGDIDIPINEALLILKSIILYRCETKKIVKLYKLEKSQNVYKEA